jgi:signal transduction histidine kinase
MSELANEAIQSLHLQAEEKKISVKIKAEPSVYAWADKDMIRIVVRNLLSNAIKFTPENGHIVVGVCGSSSGAKLYVRDSGIGIDSRTIRKINENEFYSTNGTLNEKGTGLGLALCKEFLGKNKAHLTMETAPLSGSTFSFTLPCAK